MEKNSYRKIAEMAIGPTIFLTIGLIIGLATGSAATAGKFLLSVALLFGGATLFAALSVGLLIGVHSIERRLHSFSLRYLMAIGFLSLPTAALIFGLLHGMVPMVIGISLDISITLYLGVILGACTVKGYGPF